MSTNLDFLGQYISGILNRLNTADHFFLKGQPYLAVKSLKSVIVALNFETEDERKMARGWINEIDMLDTIGSKGFTRASREYSRLRAQNAEARDLYDRLVLEIWNTLHDRKYFEMSKYLKNIVPTSKLEVTKDKPEEEAFPERLGAGING